MLLIVRNRRFLVALIGFFEVLVWVYAAGAAIQHLERPWHVMGYAGGFAAGSVVGLWLEERLALGLASIQIVCRDSGAQLAAELRDRGYGVTELGGRGRDGPVEILQTVVRRRQTRDILAQVDRWDPDAFVSVDEPRTIRRGWLFARRRK